MLVQSRRKTNIGLLCLKKFLPDHQTKKAMSIITRLIRRTAAVKTTKVEKVEKFRYLAGVVAAHEGRRLTGRTRLQKTLKLLQRVGFPTDYLFSHGYSEGIKSDLGLLEVLGLVREKQECSWDGTPYYVISATEQADLDEIKGFLPQIKLMENADLVPLELAVAYDSFRETGSGHEDALVRLRLRRKKGAKCSEDNLNKSFQLLKELNLLES